MKRKGYKKHITKVVNANKRQVEIDKNMRTLEKNVTRVNKQIRSLQRHYKKGTWATRKLQNRLSTKTVNAWDFGKALVRIPKRLTGTQVVAMIQALRQFQESATSTRRGIEETKRATKEGIKRTVALDKDIEDEDIEDMYNMLGDDDFEYFASTQQLGASTVWDLIADGIEYNESQVTFVDKLLAYCIVEDVDIRKRAIRLYNKYVL